jgi:mycothiol synthase
MEVRVLRRFAPADLDAVRALAEAVESTGAAPPFGEATWRSLADGAGGVGVVVSVDGIVTAYAHLTHHHTHGWSFEVAAGPEAKGEWLGLVEPAMGAVAADGGGHVSLWLHGGRAADEAAAEAAGFRPERELLQLRVPLPLPEASRLPAGVTIRAFVPGRDEDAWLVVNNRAFAGHPEQGDWDRATLLAREQEPWFDASGFLLAEDADGLAGFCWTKVHEPVPPREPDPLGEIYVIGVDPGRQGTGLGRALVVAGLESLASRGVRVGMLYVDGANTAAVALYGSLGFTTVRVDRAYGRDVPPSS